MELRQKSSIKPSVENFKHLQNYKAFLAQQHPYSAHTRLAYQQDVKDFLQHLEQPLKTCTRQHVRCYLEFLKHTQALHHNTLARRVASLRHFFHYLYKKECIPHDPMRVFKSYKKVSGLPKFLHQSTTEEVLESLGDDGSYLSMRGKVIVELLYGMGLRISEVKSLTMKDYMPLEGHLMVLGKGRKKRLLPLTARLVGLMDRFMACRKIFLDVLRPRLEVPPNPLFLNARGNALSVRGIRFLYDRAFQSACLSLKINPHGLRHSVATHLLERGCDLKKIQDFLGHRSLSTTQIYTHLTKSSLKKTMQQCHPLFKKAD